MKKFWSIAIIVLVAGAAWLLWPGAGVPILAYHQVEDLDDVYSVPPAQFAQQMKYLADNGYTAISLAELFAAYEGKGSLPAKPVIITFDDGYEDNVTQALPIMEKYGMRGTVFVISGTVGTPDYLTWPQIAELISHHTEIGSHTVTHVALDGLSPEAQYQEVAQSKKELEQHIGREVNFLAYPYGQFNADTKQALRQAGYKGACAGTPGLSTAGSDVYSLHRINIPHPKFGLWEFRLRLLRAQLYCKLGI